MSPEAALAGAGRRTADRLHDHVRRTIEVLQGLDGRAVARFRDAVLRTHERGGTIFACGNGGSASTASHFCQDLAKSTICGDHAARLRVVALTDSVSALTAWANDHGYQAVFEQPLRALGRPGDLLIAISGSGNSPNVLGAVRYANMSGISTFALTGFDGGELKRLAQDGVHVEAAEMELAENAHMVILHHVVCAVRDWQRERHGAG